MPRSVFLLATGWEMPRPGVDGGQHLFFVTDHSSGLRFLVDTGAEVSVLPVSQMSHSTSPAGPTLQAINHLTIATLVPLPGPLTLASGELSDGYSSVHMLSIPYLVQISCTTSAYS